MTAILNSEQVDAMDYKQCKAALKLLFKTYDMEKPLSELSKEEWDSCDAVCNTLLWLQDRIKLFEDPRIPSMDPGVAIEKPVLSKSTKPTKVGPKRRQFKIGDKIYADVQTASKKTGIALNTLRTYVSRKPDKYGYVD
jgi:hypothetical protein